MEINLNQLIISANKELRSVDNNLIVLTLLEDNMIKASKGDVVYFFDSEKLNQILEINKVELRNDKEVYGLLAKHLCNQLSASFGKKVYPEILSTKSDFI